jgi:hypothetical protein
MQDEPTQGKQTSVREQMFEARVRLEVAQRLPLQAQPL